MFSPPTEAAIPTCRRLLCFQFDQKHRLCIFEVDVGFQDDNRALKDLPSTFVQSLSSVELNLRVGVLKSFRGQWNVSVRKCLSGVLCFFGDEWDNFVVAHQLHVTDFIVFEHTGRMCFNVYAFDWTCCDKELTSSDEDFMCRFLKVVVSGVELGMMLPPAFVRLLDDAEMACRVAVLHSYKGSWKVRVKKCDDGSFKFFGNVWQDYLLIHELKANDFIVFVPSSGRGTLCFETFLFGEFFCEKRLVGSGSVSDDVSEDDDALSVESDCDISGECEDGESGTFETTILSRHHLNHVQVPVAFSRSVGMLRNGSVELWTDDGVSWLCKLTVSSGCTAGRRVYSRVRITGVSGFLRENGLKVDDKCIFNVIRYSERESHYVFKVKFMRKV